MRIVIILLLGTFMVAGVYSQPFIAARCIEGRINCGGRSLAKRTLISSPSNAPRECAYTFDAHSQFVCQMRIDFDIDLAAPTLVEAGSLSQRYECTDDILTIGEFKLCGRDRGQHLYIPFNKTGGTNSVQVSIKTADRALKPGLIAPTWKFTVTQLECPLGSPRTSILGTLTPRTFFNDGFMVAPTGCSQYFPHPTGKLTSFNFNSGSGIYPANLNYAICFRRTSSTEKLQLTSTHFQLGSEPSSEGELNEFCLSTIATEGRSEDYIQLSQAEIVEQGVRASYFCGKSLEAKSVISSAPGPITMIFNSDGIFKDVAPESGFSFVYSLV